MTPPDEENRIPPRGERLSLLKQARSVRTRAKLVDAASRLWNDRGFDETSVDDVCEYAGVAKGTFYFYFKAKEDLLIELGLVAVEGMAEEVQRAIDEGKSTNEVLQSAWIGLAARASTTPRPLLQRTVEEVFHAVGLRLQDALVGRRYIRGTLAEVLERAQTRGELSDTWDADELAGILAMVVIQALLDWSRQDSGIQELMEMLERRTGIVLKEAVLTPSVDLERPAP